MYHEELAFYSATVAVFLNVSLLPIILRCSSSKIGSYKNLLFIYTLDCALFAGVQMFMLPTFHATGRIFLFYSTKSFKHRFIPTICLINLCTCYVNIIIIISLSFIYRYAVVCRKTIIKFFKPNKSLYITLTLSLALHLWPISTDYLISPMFNPSLDDAIADEVQTTFNRSVTTVVYCGGAKRINGSYNTPLIVSKLSYIVLCSATLVINFCCTIAIVRRIKGIAHMSKQQHLLQYKLLLLLIGQTLSPFVFFSIPFLITMVSFIFDIWNFDDVFGGICCFGLILDPLMIAFIMADYRKAIFKIFDVRRPRKYLDRTTTQNIATSKN